MMEQVPTVGFMQMKDALDIFDNQAGVQQYLTFSLADEIYGVDLVRVQEIKAWDNVTRIPNTPDYLAGVLNFRGNIVPVVDLRLRFGLPFRAYTPTTVVVILKVQGARDRIVGMVVDAVLDACQINPDLIQQSPDLGSRLDTRHLTGLIQLESTMLMLLDVDWLLSVEAIG